MFLVVKNPLQYDALFRLGVGDATALLAVNAVSFFVTGLVSWHLLKAVGASISLSTIVALTFLANFLNYFGPAQPGMGAKALYLKSARNVRFVDFGIATGTNALIMTMVSGLVGVAVVAWKWGAEGVRFVELGVLSVTMVLIVFACPLFFAIAKNSSIIPNRWSGKIEDAMAGFIRLWRKYDAMATSVALVALQYSVSGLAIWMCYRAIGADIGYPLAFLIAAFLSVANILPLTPNNVGVSEILVGMITQLSGAGFSDGLVAGAFMRASHLIISVLAMPYASWQLRARPKDDFII